MKQIINICIFFVLLIAIACCKDDHEDGPCYDVFPTDELAAFGVFNQAGVSLIGENNVYNPLTILVSRGSEIITSNQVSSNDSDDIYMRFQYSSMEGGEDYNIRLNGDENETLHLIFSVEETQCYTTKNLDEFRINNVELEDAFDNIYDHRKWYQIIK